VIQSHKVTGKKGYEGDRRDVLHPFSLPALFSRFFSTFATLEGEMPIKQVTSPAGGHQYFN
jgi:hypothetical protein